MADEKNRHWLLRERPVGLVDRSHFTWTESEVPPLEDGQFLVRNLALSFDPTQRGWPNSRPVTGRNVGNSFFASPNSPSPRLAPESIAGRETGGASSVLAARFNRVENALESLWLGGRKTGREPVENLRTDGGGTPPKPGGISPGGCGQAAENTS